MRQFIVFLLLFSANVALAQDDKVLSQDDSLIAISKDTVQLKSYASRYDPQRALLLAAVIPGLGQIYNKKYWKLPLVYGGFVGIGYAINFYQGNYKKYKVQLFQNLDKGIGENLSDPGDPNGYTTGQLRTIVDKSRRERDFWTIMLGAMYLL